MGASRSSTSRSRARPRARRLTRGFNTIALRARGFGALGATAIKPRVSPRAWGVGKALLLKKLCSRTTILLTPSWSDPLAETHHNPAVLGPITSRQHTPSPDVQLRTACPVDSAWYQLMNASAPLKVPPSQAGQQTTRGEDMPRLLHLRHVIEHAAHLLPAQGPITVFIHHNTLHALEDLPFTEAVKRGATVFGCQPYLTRSRYREELRCGRIRFADLEAVLRENLGAWADEPILRFCTR